MVKLDLSDFLSDKAKIKYACAKRAIVISQKYPKDLYPDFDYFIRLLESENNILKWTAITAANTIGALSEIAINKPEFSDEIISALLKVEKAKYYNKGEISPECHNIAISHVIKSFQKFGKKVFYRKDVQEFLKRQTENTRPKLKELSEKLLLQIT